MRYSRTGGGNTSTDAEYIGDLWLGPIVRQPPHRPSPHRRGRLLHPWCAASSMRRRSPSPAGKTQGVQSTTWTSKTLGAKHRPWIYLAVPVKGWLEASLAMLNQYRENVWASALFDIKTNSKGRSTTEGYSFVTDCLCFVPS